jgi:peptidoglycan/LPS O-acetylase OafA/YrhL
MGTAIEIAASTLYAENIWLAHQARDYLVADDPASPVQHYWSLSVEEQFYIVWPVLLWLALQLAPRARLRPKAMFGALIGTLFVTTLAYGIWLTMTASSQAYFSTLARAWELALGGMWAVLSSERSAPSTSTTRWPAPALGIGGALAIGSAALLFDAQTPFPGYAALLPTLGACAILIAGSLTARWPGDVLLCNPVLQYVGDRSYSLYLWHWPVLVLIEGRTGDLTGSHRLWVVAISFALAHATKRWVEDPCRSARFAADDARRPFALAGLSILISLSAASVVHQLNAPAPDASWGDVVGARALEQPGYDFRSERVDALVPPTAHASEDTPSGHREGCYQTALGTLATVCAYGSATAKLKIALVGDSHAAHWFPAFEQLALDRDVRVFGIAKSGCAFSLSTVRQPDHGGPYIECLTWTKNVLAFLTQHTPDLILIAQSSEHRIAGANAREDVDLVARGMSLAWRELSSHGMPIIALASTPWFPATKMPRECVAVSKDWQRDCVLPRAAVLPRDAVSVAAAETGTPLIDLNDGLCVGDNCLPAAGGVLIYRDFHHLTATYARTLAPNVERALAAHGVVLGRK